MVFKMSGRGSRVTIDGRDFVGGSVIIDRNGVVTVDGVEQEGSLVGPVNVTIQGGTVDHVETVSGRVEVSGGTGSIKTMSGDVHCGDVTGSVSTMSGDVTCGVVRGSVSTMSGNIRETKP